MHWTHIHATVTVRRWFYGQNFVCKKKEKRIQWNESLCEASDWSIIENNRRKTQRENGISNLVQMRHHFHCDITVSNEKPNLHYSIELSKSWRKSIAIVLMAVDFDLPSNLLSIGNRRALTISTISVRLFFCHFGISSSNCICRLCLCYELKLLFRTQTHIKFPVTK